MSDPVPGSDAASDPPGGGDTRRSCAAGPSCDAFRALEERLERRAIRRDGWTVLILVFGGVAVIFSIIGIGLGSRAIDEAKSDARAAAAAAVAATQIPTGPGGASSSPATAGSCPTNDGLSGNVSDTGAKPAGGGIATVQAGDFFFNPTCVTDTPAGTVTLTVHNAGRALHNVSVPEQGIDTDVAPGETVTVSIKVTHAAVPYFCKFHRTSGMVGSVLPAR